MRFTRVVLLACLAALVVVPAALALRFTDDAYKPPVGETGKPYPNWSFTGAGGCGPALPYEFHLLNSSAPPGLTIDESGLVHGTPTQAGDFSFWLELSDENPPSASWCRPESAQRQFTIKIIQGLTIVQRQSSLGAAFLNEPYNLQLTTNSPGASLTWSIATGSLPAGLSLNPSTGLIAGSPSATGDFTFKVQVKDAGTRSDSQSYSLTVVPKLQLGGLKGAGEIGIPLQLTPQATGGKPGYKWSLEGTLPAGLTMDPATGAISGTPTSAGKSSVKLTVTDTLGLKTTVDVPLTISARLSVTKKRLPAAKVGTAYDTFFRATGGVVPRTWTILGGRPGLLPKGLKLNGRTGELSGTPKQAGTFRLRLQVTDKLGAHSALGFVLKVVP